MSKLVGLDERVKGARATAIWLIAVSSSSAPLVWASHWEGAPGWHFELDVGSGSWLIAAGAALASAVWASRLAWLRHRAHAALR